MGSRESDIDSISPGRPPDPAEAVRQFVAAGRAGGAEATRQTMDRAGADVIAVIQAALATTADNDSRVLVALGCAVPAMVAAIFIIKHRFGVSEGVALDVLRRVVADDAPGDA